MAARVYSLVINFCMYCATKTNENTMSFCCKRHPNLSHDATCLQKVARRLVMAVAVCLVAITWPTSAAASCGNYLFRHGKPVDKPLSLMTEHHDVQNHVGEKNKASNELPAPPCHGPNCSGNRIPLIPVPVAPSNLIRGFDQAAILESLAQTPTPRRAIEIPTSDRGAFFVASSIFRPPMA